MPGAPLIEQVEPDRSAKETARGILELLAGDIEPEPAMVQEAMLEKLRWWERGDKVMRQLTWGWRRETSKEKINSS